MISIDTECTGIDFHHGARPFYVTSCDEKGKITYWEWNVNPLTREVEIPEDDVFEIFRLITPTSGRKEPNPWVVLQNPKFDARMLSEVVKNWPWFRTYDTLLAAHLLASNQPKDLTSLAIQYLGISIKKYEDKLEEAVQACRSLCRSKFPEWMIAKKGLPCMPSAKEETWKFDMWLPRAIAQELNYPDDHEYWRVLQEYSNADSAVTLPLYHVMEEEIKRRGLWEIYLERLKLLPVIFEMEQYGVTLNMERLKELSTEYLQGSIDAKSICVGIAKEYDYELIMPKGGKNKSLDNFVFGCLDLPVVKETAKGNPSLDKYAMEEYLITLPAKSKELHFMQNLEGSRKRDTAISFMESYRKFAVQEDIPEFYRLHPSMNPTGTDTLRLSCQNPNSQQISDKEEFGLRPIFCPLPNREWYSEDYENIELKLPGYKANEKKMIELFEKPNEPPYFGSYHLLNCSLLYPDLFWPVADIKGEFKRRYGQTWYKWGKNTGFCVQYGGQKAKTDATAHKDGAFELLNAGLPNVTRLKAEVMKFAEKNGYIETMIDKSLGKGYPLLCTRTEWGKILPTVPFSYYIQGTAMWCTCRALVRCHNQLREWEKKDKFDGRIIISPHDEIVFDFPRGPKPDSNRWRAERMRELMQQSGDDIGIPLTVSMNYHPVSWGE